ncbi:MAG: hypothetical protein GOU98_03900 [Candidatus Altiarchaeota archaeon]|nr:hypothetical protein [Candidatus Altiarchaeota archaeon]
MILKYVLANAYQYGKADFNSVTSKVFSDPELRKNAKSLIPEIKKAVERVNKMKKDEIATQLKKIAPELMQKEKKVEKRELPPLENAQSGLVKLRLPPEPNGYLHIGHALSFWLNKLYTDKYDGELVLKLEDTNPAGEKEEYYRAIESDLKWLGITWDDKFILSEHLGEIEILAKKLIEKEKVYMCKCKSEVVRKGRMEGIPDSCRKHSVAENDTLWKELFGKKPYTLRWKGDPKSKNTVLRDPTLYRVVDLMHPHTKQNHIAYPTYDLASAVTDGMLGITHVLRSEEFLMRAELHKQIIEALDMKAPTYIHFGRFEMDGSPTSKRKVKPLVEDKLVEGWNDPRLSTIIGLKRRGIVPKTFKDLAIASGPYRGKRVIDWKRLLGFNKKNIDSVSKRVFVIKDAVKLKLVGANRDVKMNAHPSEKLGIRVVKLKDEILIEKADLGPLLRLKGAYNVKIKDGVATYSGDKLIRPIVQWLSEFDLAELWESQKLMVDGKIQKISKTTVKVEKREWKQGEFIQMERIGFARVDSLDPLRLIFVGE